MADPPDPLIVGSGIAGLFVALRAREEGLSPVLVTKGGLDESNTRYAQGGIAAAVGPDDSPARHLRDTVRAGDGIVARPAATLLTTDAPRRIADLVRYGVPFDTWEGRIALGREAAHSRARILHAGGDATGLRIEETLKQAALDAGIPVRERTRLRAIDRATGDRLEVRLSRDDLSGVESIDCRSIVLATGGAGALYRESSNPSVATGEGVAIAWRAGALLADMEFLQFHPTAFCRTGAPRHLITEAIRGEGAVLVNEAGERFLPTTPGEAELAPRHLLSRAIVSELARTHARCVYLDATGLPSETLVARFPSVSRFLATQGLDLSRDRIPVAPVAHFMIGGVATDLDGRTTLPGVFACGEVAATGVHGANRLGSNSLLEGIVFGERVVRAIRSRTRGAPRAPRTVVRVGVPAGDGKETPATTVPRVGDLLWESVGIVRSASGISVAVAELERLVVTTGPAAPDELAGPAANAAATALLIATAAAARTESRGAHYRTDAPTTDPTWRRHLGLVRA